MVEVRSSPTLRTIPVLIAAYLFCLPAQAQSGGTTASPQTSTYVFLPAQSAIVQTGGIAGIDQAYTVEGQFQLTIDPNAKAASFAGVDAMATAVNRTQQVLDPNRVFNLASLAGTVIDDTTIHFTGKASDGSEVHIAVTLQHDLARLIGQTGSGSFPLGRITRERKILCTTISVYVSMCSLPIGSSHQCPMRSWGFCFRLPIMPALTHRLLSVSVRSSRRGISVSAQYLFIKAASREDLSSSMVLQRAHDIRQPAVA